MHYNYCIIEMLHQTHVTLIEAEKLILKEIGLEITQQVAA
jgi:hypothetical protein